MHYLHLLLVVIVVLVRRVVGVIVNGRCSLFDGTRTVVYGLQQVAQVHVLTTLQMLLVVLDDVLRYFDRIHNLVNAHFVDGASGAATANSKQGVPLAQAARRKMRPHRRSAILCDDAELTRSLHINAQSRHRNLYHWEC